MLVKETTMKIPNFLNECADIVERGKINDVEINKVTIEGIYLGEIFRFSYKPMEEGYGDSSGPEDTQ